MMRRLFFDANVLFTAAHNPNGKAALVITLGKNGLWQLATSPCAKEEARRNLARKYPQCINHFEDNIGCFLLVNDRIDIPCPTSLPEKDRPIYRAAHACRANVLSR